MRRGLLRFGAIAGVLLFLGVSGVMCQRVARRGRYAAPYSSYGAGPEGTRALYLLTEARGRPVERWVEDLGGLPEGGVLVALGGCEGGLRRPLSGYEEDALEAWVEAGGVLIVAGAEGYLDASMPVRLRRVADQCAESLFAWMVRAEADAADDDEADEPEEEVRVAPQAFGPDAVGDEPDEDGDLPPLHWAVPRSPVLEGIGALPVRQPALIDVDAEAVADRLLVLEGEPVAVAVPVGEGTVLALSTASLLQNREIAISGGAPLFVRLLDHFAPGAPVRFDEYHLGVGSTRSIVQYAREVGGGPVALQLLVLVAFVLMRHGARFGAPQVPPPPLPGGTATYVRSLGGLYRKTGDAAATLKVVADDACRRIAAHHRVPPLPTDQLAAALAPRSAEAAEAVEAVAALAGDGAVSTPALLARTRKIDAIVARAIDDTERNP